MFYRGQNLDWLKIMFFLLSLILMLDFTKCQSDRFAYRHNTDDPFSYFGSKTAYKTVSAKQYDAPPNCSPLQLWLLSRHGTRHPHFTIIDNIAKLNEYKNKITENSSMSKDEIEAIQTWQFNLTELDGNQLNSQGIDDLLSLGLKLRQSYAEIFNETYNSENFEVLSSPKSRCVKSAYNFLKSAFNANITNIPTINGDDIKLNMSKFKKSNDDDDMEEQYGYFRESRKFEGGKEMQQLVLNLSKAMGLNYTLPLDTVMTMYESCRYEKSWHVNSRPAWCAAFSQDDLDVLEYLEDIKNYFTKGYGDAFNERLGCPVIKDLVDKFRHKSRTRLGPKGVFYFGHTSNTMGAVVRLGIARDAWTLTAENYGIARDRLWRTSYVNPFAANLMAVLYDCSDGDKVTFYVNGVPTPVGNFGCTLCPWQLIDGMLDPIVSSPSCTFQETPSSADVLSSAVSVAMAIVVAAGALAGPF